MASASSAAPTDTLQGAPAALPSLPESGPSDRLPTNSIYTVGLASAKFKRGRALLNSEPLLKFHQQEGKPDEPYLDPKGLKMIKSITGRICPIVFIGDGRAGKSYLASRLVGSHEAFVSSDSAESVTEGIDIAVAPLRAGSKDKILVMDCEGGNNAMAEIRNLVNVFAVVACTQVVFVANSMMSEAALDNLATAMAARQLVQFDQSEGIAPPRRLTFVVNKTNLKYEDNMLEKTLDSVKDASRAGTRTSIKETFEERRFAAVKLNMMPEFEDNVTKYLEVVREGAAPLAIGGSTVTGDQLCVLLEVVRTEVTKQNSVGAPSIMRGVVLDGFLAPLSQTLLVEALEKLPRKLGDYDPALADKDLRSDVLRKFDQKSSQISQRELVAEARETLSMNLDRRWNELLHQNELLGEQVKETTVENRETIVMSEQVPLGGQSLLKNISVRQELVSYEARAISYKKNGKVGECSDWKPHGEPSKRLVDKGLREGIDRLPRMQGHLRLRVQTLLDLCGLSSGLSCYMILTDTHLMWWFGPSSMEVRPDHCYCLLQRPEVTLTQHGEDASTFLVRMGDDGPTFTFESEQQDAPRWADAFLKHATLAGRASECFLEPNLPVPPCLNELKERNMQDILRSSNEDCSERCSRLVIWCQGISIDSPTQPQEQDAQRPRQIEMEAREVRVPLRAARAP